MKWKYMLNALWTAMVIVGIIYGSFTGRLSNITEEAINSAKEAVNLCITMVGVMGFWTGLMEIARKSGLLENVTKAIKPLLHFVFPEIPKGHPAEEYIATNCIANVFGLGWAATPAGLKAMEALVKLEEERGTRGYPGNVASKEMCTFLVLNISSLQLIPINIIAYRSEYGSLDPTSIIGPALIATCISTIIGIIFCKLRKN